MPAQPPPRPPREETPPPEDDAPAAEPRAKPHVVPAFLRFGVVGAVGTLVNLGVLHLLHTELGLGFTRSSAIATEAAILSNYLGNELFTFHLRELSWRRVLQYNAAALVSLGVTVAVATAAKEVVHPLLAQLAGIAAGSSLNFLANFGWIWRR
ncbi:MAG: GtrA family protein [Euzebyales bacterium]|nr:GtrA family protein [Euzebyales bacterium]